MASSSSQRMIHQDYIARIRYSNTLPPPPNPPKLLDIPNTGLASGQYTTPGFASRLARDQPLNIEADAELGMPLDLVGMPGIFDGDESSIQAPLQTPVPHPHDRALLRPLSTLGKPKFSDSGVSFLRRTEYISSHTSRSRFESTTSRSLINSTGNRIKRVADTSIDTESPENIKKRAEDSFTIAANLLKAPREIRHPNRSSKATLIDAYPILPDLDSFPDAGGYCTIKFLTNPVPPSSNYDTRLETSMLKPVEPSAEEEIKKQTARENYERDPEHFPPPDETMEYEFFMTETPAESLNYKRKFDPLDPEHDSEALYPQQNGEGEGCFRFKRIRAYESQTISGSTTNKYDDDIVIAVHDGKDGLRQKGAFYYPIVQRMGIRPQRNKNIDLKRMQFQPGQGQRIEERESAQTDFLDVQVLDPEEEMRAEMEVFRTMPFGKAEEEGAEGDGETGNVGEVAVKSVEVDGEGDSD